MLDTDTWNTAWKALTHAMQADARLSIFEQERVTAIDAKLDADLPTTKEEDMLIVEIMRRFVLANENYSV
jgi:hypothetical protein